MTSNCIRSDIKISHILNRLSLSQNYAKQKNSSLLILSKTVRGVISYSNEIHIDCLIATDFSNFDIHHVLIIVIANSQPRYQLMYALSYASTLIAIQFLFGILLSVSVLGDDLQTKNQKRPA